MALREGPRAGPEEGPALPHILITDFSASSTAAWGSLEGVPATAPNPQPGPEPPRAAEEDAECLSKPELEQDASEDGGSSLGSSSVALDPVEKEWLQGAASGHLLTLSHLLKQDPSLATRKDFTSGVSRGRGAGCFCRGSGWGVLGFVEPWSLAGSPVPSREPGDLNGSPAQPQGAVAKQSSQGRRGVQGPKNSSPQGLPNPDAWRLSFLPQMEGLGWPPPRWTNTALALGAPCDASNMSPSLPRPFHPSLPVPAPISAGSSLQRCTGRPSMARRTWPRCWWLQEPMSTRDRRA
ncbi:uncharacterized protein LOC116831187 isoform X2 [Chelonoidis abingdonii]|uniref:uncharacterized protein LOC116831187 isoform X2 n=1 Tax=Chelonoidis abingdonii TaxID=106734 RepID=UPI003F4945E2